MKKSFSWLGPVTVVVAGCAWLVSSPRSAAVVQPTHRTETPNFDSRAAAPLPVERLAERNQGINRLTRQVPGVQVSFDRLLDSPRFIHARNGFLTKVGAAAVRAANRAGASADAYAPVKEFLSEHQVLFGHGAEVFEQASVTRDSVGAHNGMRTVVWQQRYAGLPVFNALLIANVTAQGELVTLGSHFLPNLASASGGVLPAQARITEVQAMLAALENLGNHVSAGEVQPQGVGESSFQRYRIQKAGAYVRQVWLPMTRFELRLAYETLVTKPETLEMFQMVVDAQTGRVLVRRGLTKYISDASYNVYTSDSPSPFSPGWPSPNNGQPALTNRALVTLSALDVNASPNGWINDVDNETRGNNVDAFADHDFDGLPDGPRPQGNPTRVFDFPLDLSQSPLTYSNASTVQMFYLINRYHDLLYQLGFTEAAGNFQVDNFGRGGAGGDEVIALVQAGAGIGVANNAFFQTPPDGANGTCAMFVWDSPAPDRDGDLDAEIVFHEATHGTSGRLVGGGAGISALQSDGMGEGWSDFFSAALLSNADDDLSGTYNQFSYSVFQLVGLTQNYYFGARRYPYCTDLNKNPLTFKDIDPAAASTHPGVPINPLSAFLSSDPSEVHNAGEVWCMALWEVRANLITKHGFSGNQLVLQLVVDGMKLAPENPTFLEARDAILLADQVNNGGANIGEIWAGFAKRGMGVSAVAPPSDTTTGVIEAYDVPGLQVEATYFSGGNGNGVLDINECNQLALVLRNTATIPFGGISVQLSSATPGVSFGAKTSGYPDMDVGVVATNLVPFSISTSPGFVCGTPIVLKLLIKADQATSQVTLTFPTGTNGIPVRFDSILPVGVPDGDLAGTNSSLLVTNITSAIGKVSVSVFLTHTWVSDMTLELISPDGVTNRLTSFNGGSGDNYGANCTPETLRTTFDDAAATPITAGFPPFVGSYQPQQPLSIYVGKAGTNVNGVWKLRLVDDVRLDVGVLNCWSLFLSPASCEDGGGGCPGSDLTVGITDGPDPVFVGSNLVYTISATNYGPSAAKNAVITHQLPASVVFVSATASQGSCVNAGGTVVCNLGNFPAEGRATATVTVLPTAIGTISSTVNITSNEGDPDGNNNSASTITHVNPPTAELAVGLRDAPDPALVGGVLTYTVSVTNNGPSTASGVTITNTLPPSVTVQATSLGQGISSVTGNVVIFSVGSLTNGGRVTGTINVTPTALGTVAAVARVAALQTDPIVGNNTITATTVIGPAADLALSITDQPDPVVVGSEWTYRLAVTNSGPSVANAAAVNFTLPTGVTVVSHGSSQGNTSLVGNALTADLGSLPPSGTAAITVVVKAANSGFYSGNASVSSSAADPNPANNGANVGTTVAPPTVQIVPAGATVTQESQSPPNGAIDNGEVVTMVLRLRNAGNVPNTNGLTATLLATNGVSSPSAAQTYGILAPGDVPTGHEFSFTASGANGGTISPTLHLQDGTNDLGLVSYTFTLPTVQSFTNPATISVLDAVAASPYPSVISVAGVTGLVSRVTVTLSQANHSFAEDLDILLVSPTGQKVMLMSDAGSPNGLADTTISFADSGAVLPENGQILATTYAPADYKTGDVFPGPAPAGPYATALAAFNDSAPNGNWSLFIVDDEGGDAGNIAGGWSLSLTTVSPVNQIADVRLAGTVTPLGSALIGDPLAFNFTVTNAGPSAATGLAFTNLLPAGATLVSAVSSNGVVTTDGSQVVVSLGSLAVGGQATVVVTLIPKQAGLLVNTATVSASENDLNLPNNTASVSKSVAMPSADLTLVQTAPATAILGGNLTIDLVVSNQGPQVALDVVLTDLLPAGLAFVSGSSSSGSVSNFGGQVTAELGSLSAGGTAQVSLVIAAGTLGSQTNVASVETGSADSVPANNAASAVVQVVAPFPVIVAAEASLLDESLAPPDQAVGIGETVTLSLALRNDGSADTADLVATLQPTGGVTAPSGPQTYGNLIAGGGSLARAYTFTAAGANGGQVTATLQLQDGAQDLGTVSFTFLLPGTGTFANTNAITIPNQGAATPYPATITVSGMTGLVSKVTVGLNDLSHGFPDDLDVLLVGPTGRKVVLMSDAGGGHAVAGLNLVLDDTGAALPDKNSISSGTYRPTDYEGGDIFPAPAPAGVPAAHLAAFHGSEANGTWSLYVMDDANGDVGTIAGGWTLTVTTVTTVSPVADLEVAITDAPDPVYVGDALTYTIAVTNRGPATAAQVMVADSLPAGLSFVSGETTQGTVAAIGSLVTAALGDLANGAGALIQVRVSAAFNGFYTNSAVATGNVADVNPGNSFATAVTQVRSPRPVRFTEVLVDGGEFQATLNGEPGLSYTVLASTNLTDWTPVSTNTPAANGLSKFTDQVVGQELRYYRAVRLMP